jgi:hypothetical protein
MPASASPSGGALPPMLVLEVDVVGVAGIPDDASSVALNVTAVSPADDGFLTAFPCDETAPSTSNLNYRADVTVPNAVISRVSADGTVCIATSAATDVIVDISGYFPAASPLAPLPNPQRVLDTRAGLGAPKARVGAGATLQFSVGGVRGTPADAAAAVINVTAVNPDEAGFATVYPCGQPLPDTSSLNFGAGQTTPNLVITRLGTGGTVCVKTTTALDLLADVTAYFPAGAGDFTPITNPQRVLDTRNGIGAPIGPALASRELGFQVVGRAGVPSSATAVVLNVTATQAVAAGYTTVYPCGTAVPATSSLNFQSQGAVPNLVIARIGVNGRVCTQSSVDVGLIADVAGYFEGTSAFVPLASPYRAADTRTDGQVRCNLAVSRMTNRAVTVTDLRTGAQRTVSNPLMIESMSPRIALLPDCSGFVAAVAEGSSIGPTNVTEFKFDGSATVFPRITPDPPLAVLDDGTAVLVTVNGVINARTGQQMTRFVDQFGHPLPPFTINGFVVPVGITGDGLAAYQLGISGSPATSIGYWDVHSGQYLFSGPLPRAPGFVPSPALSRHGSYMSTLMGTPEGMRISVETLDGVPIVISPFIIVPPPSTNNYVQWIGDGSMIVCQYDGGNPGVYRWDLFSAPTLLYRGSCPAAAG